MNLWKSLFSSKKPVDKNDAYMVELQDKLKKNDDMKKRLKFIMDSKVKKGLDLDQAEIAAIKRMDGSIKLATVEINKLLAL